MRYRRPVLLALAAGMVALVAVGGAGWWATRPTPTDAAGTSIERLQDYGVVPPFTLAERSGKRVTRDTLAGMVWVADFIYTECTETCPAQSLQFSRLQRDFATADRLAFVSITVDPSTTHPRCCGAMPTGTARRIGGGS